MLVIGGPDLDSNPRSGFGAKVIYDLFTIVPLGKILSEAREEGKMQCEIKGGGGDKMREGGEKRRQKG